MRSKQGTNKRDEIGFSWAKWSNKNLSVYQAAVFRLLRYPTDVPIERMWKRISNDKDMPFRGKQMRIGAIISRINGKLAPLGWIIKPGAFRRTYRLRRRQPGE
jgi:hypothetical protein